MTDELMKSLHLNIPAKTPVKQLTVAKQQMVEIAKSLSHNNTKILVMDEPSAALTESEIEDLFTFIRRLKATGVGIIYISHRMDELKQITDRITVMRDGQYVDTVDTATTPMEKIVQMMVGPRPIPMSRPMHPSCWRLSIWSPTMSRTFRSGCARAKSSALQA